MVQTAQLLLRTLPGQPVGYECCHTSLEQFCGHLQSHSSLRCLSLWRVPESVSLLVGPSLHSQIMLLEIHL